MLPLFVLDLMSLIPILAFFWDGRTHQDYPRARRNIGGFVAMVITGIVVLGVFGFWVVLLVPIVLFIFVLSQNQQP